MELNISLVEVKLVVKPENNHNNNNNNDSLVAHSDDILLLSFLSEIEATHNDHF